MWNTISIILVAALCAVVAYLCIKLYCISCDLKNVAQRVHFIVNNQTNINVDLPTSNKWLASISKSLYNDIERLKAIRDEYRKRDIELRESIANISHDLRTPLTVINSYLNLIERNNPSLDDKTRAAIDVVKTRAITMTALIEELFNYSVYENDVLALSLANVCLNDYLERTLTEFYHVITQRGINPQISITQNTIVRNLDVNALDRVVSNVLNNAIKYSQGDMSVTLTDNGQMIFCNSAPNLDAVSTAKLFNRFFTVENARSSTGLGLSIAKLLTEQMGGQIWAEFADGKLSIHLSF